MGRADQTVKIPTRGRVFIDANILIYAVETTPQWWPALRPLIEAAAVGEVELHASEIIVPEVLVVPLKEDDSQLLEAYRAALDNSERLRLWPVTRSILEVAASLRAMHGLRTPDAIHAATARAHGAEVLLTNDSKLARVPQLSTVLLGEAARS